jgi:nucleoside-diphosphate-sugar epimerase
VPNLVEHDEQPSLVNNDNQGLRRSACFFADDPEPERGEERVLSPSAVPFFVYYSHGVAHCAVRIAGAARARWTYLDCAEYLDRFGLSAPDTRPPVPVGVDEDVASAVWLTAYTMGVVSRLENHDVVPELDGAVVERALATLVPGGVSHRVDARRAAGLSAALLPAIRHGLHAGLSEERRSRAVRGTGRRVLVSGGNSFVGEYLAHRLADLGHEVLSLDAEKPDGVHGAVTYLVADGAPPVSGSDAVVHAGPCAWADSSAVDPADLGPEYERVRALLTAGAGTVVFLSSYRVYAGCAGTVDESAAGSADDPVAEGIRRIERLCAEHGAFVLRLGTPYGPGMPRHNALAEIVLRSASSRPVAVAADERWPVQLVHLKDIARAVDAVLDRTPGDRVFNVSNPEALSHRDVCDAVFRVVRPVPVEHADRLRSCFTNPVASVAAAAGQLGWRPRVDVEYALHGYVQWLAHDRDD